MVNEDAIRKSFQKIKDEMSELKKENSVLNDRVSKLKKDIHSDSFIEKLAESLAKKIKKPEKKVPNDVDLNNFKKEKVKKKIIELCSERITSKALKTLITKRYNLCSRATYYRYIKELKKAGYLQAIEINDEPFLIATKVLSNKNIYK